MKIQLTGYRIHPNHRFSMRMRKKHSVMIMVFRSAALSLSRERALRPCIAAHTHRAPVYRCSRYSTSVRSIRYSRISHSVVRVEPTYTFASTVFASVSNQ